MAEITAALVKELREKTGTGMMDCKKALTETGGDVEAAPAAPAEAAAPPETPEAPAEAAPEAAPAESAPERASAGAEKDAKAGE